MILHEQQQEIPQLFYSSMLQGIISRCLDKNPLNRPNADELLLLLPKDQALKMTTDDLMLMMPESTESTVDSRNYIRTMEKLQEQGKSKVKTMQRSASSFFKSKMVKSRSPDKKELVSRHQ